MKILKDLFNNAPKEKHLEWFTKIAKHLMTGFAIETSNSIYIFKEIEFYYYSDSHPDKSTYGYIDKERKHDERIMRHKKCQTHQGTWFFHYSGVDLVFGNVDSPGGILIRGIQNIKTSEIIKGPLVVLLELINQQLDMEGVKCLQLKLVPIKTKIECSINAQRRHKLNSGGFENEEYRFFAE